MLFTPFRPNDHENPAAAVIGNTRKPAADALSYLATTAMVKPGELSGSTAPLVFERLSPPSKSKTFFALIVCVPVVGLSPAVACVTWLALPDLSSHCETAPALDVMVAASSALYQALSTDEPRSLGTQGGAVVVAAKLPVGVTDPASVPCDKLQECARHAAGRRDEPQACLRQAAAQSGSTARPDVRKALIVLRRVQLVGLDADDAVRLALSARDHQRVKQIVLGDGVNVARLNLDRVFPRELVGRHLARLGLSVEGPRGVGLHLVDGHARLNAVCLNPR
jgi:hypothetical protein